MLDWAVERPTRIAPPGSRAPTLEPPDADPDARAFMVDREFAHIHNPPIGSLHPTLPPALRALALDRGRAMRPSTRDPRPGVRRRLVRIRAARRARAGYRGAFAARLASPRARVAGRGGPTV